MVDFSGAGSGGSIINSLKGALSGALGMKEDDPRIANLLGNNQQNIQKTDTQKPQQKVANADSNPNVVNKDLGQVIKELPDIASHKIANNGNIDTTA